MAVNHVVINGETSLDLRGATAHNAAGEAISGTYVPKTTTVDGTTLKLAPATVSGNTIIV